MASICDHFTRVYHSPGRVSSRSPVIGLLFGIKLSSGSYTVLDTADAVFDIAEHNNEVTLNVSAIGRIKDLLVAVYPLYELIGWYTTGLTVTSLHEQLNRTFTAITTSPLLCLLDENSTIEDSKQLPLAFFLSTQASGDMTDAPSMEPVPYRLEAGQVESLAIDQVTKVAAYSKDESALEAQNRAILLSVQSLGSKIDLIIGTLSKMRDGQILFNTDFIRRANQVLCQLPAQPTDEFTDSFQTEITECYMLAYLSGATKTSRELTDLSGLVVQTSSSAARFGTSRLQSRGHH